MRTPYLTPTQVAIVSSPEPVIPSEWNATDQIIVLVAENPKKPGTKAYQQFAEIRSEMTVAEFLQCGDWAKAELRYCLKKGFVKIQPPPL